MNHCSLPCLLVCSIPSNKEKPGSHHPPSSDFTFQSVWLVASELISFWERALSTRIQGCEQFLMFLVLQSPLTSNATWSARFPPTPSVELFYTFVIQIVFCHIHHPILESPNIFNYFLKFVYVQVHSLWCKIPWILKNAVSCIHHHSIIHNSFTILKKISCAFPTLLFPLSRPLETTDSITISIVLPFLEHNING